jgi:hypothetical protein
MSQSDRISELTLKLVGKLQEENSNLNFNFITEPSKTTKPEISFKEDLMTGKLCATSNNPNHIIENNISISTSSSLSSSSNIMNTSKSILELSATNLPKYKTCSRCHSQFQYHFKDEKLIQEEFCSYHPGRVEKSMIDY